MKSIKTKLMFFFLLFLVIMSALNVVQLVIHLNAQREYKAVTDNLITESEVDSLTKDTIRAFYYLTQNINNKDRLDEYNRLHGQLDATFARLDKTITYKDSVVIYTGLKNTVDAVLQDCDAGIAKASNGDLGVSSYFEDANRKSVYVSENTGSLILKELEYSKQLQKDIEQAQNTRLSIAIGSFILILILCAVFLISYLHSMITPLTKLAKISETVSSGNIDVKVDKELLDKDDEIGILSNSFNKMITSLRDNINQLNEVNAAVIKVREELEQKTKDKNKAAPKK